MAVDGACALRKALETGDLERCLTGIFLFYLPPGTEVDQAQLSGDLSLRDGLGLVISMAKPGSGEALVLDDEIDRLLGYLAAFRWTP